MKSFLRRTCVITISIVIVAVIAHSGDTLLNLILTPLPKNLQTCLSQKFTNEVNAQQACTNITHSNSVAVWDSSGRVRESNVYEDYAVGLGIGVTSPLEKLHVDQGAASISGGGYTTTGNVLLHSNASIGPYIAGNTNSAGNATKTDAAMRIQVGNGFKIDSSPSTTAGSARTFTNQFVMTSTGNITAGTAAAIGDSKISVTSTNGSNDSMLTMQQSGPAFSVLPWTNVVYLGAGVYYNNGAWAHSNTDSANNQLFAMIPGTGVRWFADGDTSNNNPITWDVVNGRLLWDNEGQWAAPINYGGQNGATISGESTIFVKQQSGGTATGTHYYYTPSGGSLTSAGTIRGDATGFGLHNSNSNGFALRVPIGTNDVVVNGSIYNTSGIYYAGGSNFNAIQGNDNFLRLNSGGQFTNGVYTPGAFRVDGVATFNNNVNINTGKTLMIDSAAGAPIQIFTQGSSTGNVYQMYTSGGGAGVDSADVNHYLQTAAGNYRWYFKTGGTQTLKMTLASNGNLTITGAYSPSDIRLKKDIVTTKGALDKLDKIDGVEFTWKEDNRRAVGFIAQTVEKVFPLLVSTDEQGMKTVSYANMSAYIVEAIKELHALFNKLAVRITTIETKQSQQEELIKKQQEMIEKQQQQINNLEKRLGKLDQQ